MVACGSMTTAGTCFRSVMTSIAGESSVTCVRPASGRQTRAMPRNGRVARAGYAAMGSPCSDFGFGSGPCANGSGLAPWRLLDGRGQRQLRGLRHAHAILDVFLAEVADRRVAHHGRDDLSRERHVLGGLPRR